MSFSDINFICIFLPVFMFIYMVTGTAHRKYVIAVSSLIFVAIGGIGGIFQMLSVLVVNYVLLMFQRGRGKKGSKILLAACILMNLLFLVLSRISHILVFSGLSFMVFRFISIHIDRYRKDLKKCPGFVEYMCYVSMFITLSAGPVTRYNDIEKSIKIPKVRLSGIDRGFRLFTAGLAFKVLLAENLDILWSQIISPGAETLSVPMSWLGAFAASAWIYYDFLGYSLMAIGLGIMTGISVPENFNEPYSSGSISEFYRRWHITLGRWFRDYVYIPLGGSRLGPARSVVNIMIVWILTGVWHGGSPNYLIWGVILGLLVAVEKMPFYKKMVSNDRVRIFMHIPVLLIIAVTWCIFKNEDTATMISYLMSLFGLNPAGQVLSTWQQFFRFIGDYLPVLIPGVIFMTPFPRKVWDKYSDSPAFAVLLIILFWFTFVRLKAGNTSDFLYMQF
ncbi:MAG: hypothetical protein K6E33_08120 [Lachnospiraceae bacterium]|nr:hypothetical protein [Lachnospiraceae bacterium]